MYGIVLAGVASWTYGPTPVVAFAPSAASASEGISLNRAYSSGAPSTPTTETKDSPWSRLSSVSSRFSTVLVGAMDPPANGERRA